MDFAAQLTREPTSVGVSTIDSLRAHGWDDAEILTATQIVGFFNQYVRIAEALGVEPEPEMKRDPTVWPSP